MIHAWRYLKLCNTGQGSKYELQGETVKSLHGFLFHSRETWQSSCATDSKLLRQIVLSMFSNPGIIHPNFQKKDAPEKWLRCHFRISMLQGVQSIVNHFNHVMFGKASPFLPSGLKNQKMAPISLHRNWSSQKCWKPRCLVFSLMEKLESLELEARCCESSLVGSNLNGRVVWVGEM